VALDSISIAIAT